MKQTPDGSQPADDRDGMMDDPRLLRAVAEYQEALEAGRRPSRAELLARYPDLGEALNECLDGLELLHNLAPHIEGTSRAGRPSPVPNGLELGTPLGDFRLVREIGRGGMGVVYEAEQLSLGRRIALKVLPFALTLDARQLQRFKTEARAAAQLHHTNIVPIYSVGCERGVHFYAMQLIDGQTLAEVIAELRRQKRVGQAAPPVGPLGLMASPYAPPRESHPSAAGADVTTLPHAALSTSVDRTGKSYFRRVAELGMQAADALEHAHRAGVVHRDVKPGNLLVDFHGRLWITDFGLAQLQNDAAVTLTGDLVGTLRYMSPEQAQGSRGLLDHRTDIYSLGVTLYEMLTLEAAFQSNDRHELLRQIAVEDPPPPRHWSRAVPFDLETIVLKAIAKRPEDRYATAGELAEDLRCFLDSKPLRARRPTVWERMAKWSRRHRGLVAAGVVLLVLTAIGFATSTFLIAREQANTQAANEQLRQEERQTKEAYNKADENLQQARRMLDFFTQMSEDEPGNLEEARRTRRRLLEAALDYYQDFIDQHQGDSSIRKELAASHQRVANLLYETGYRHNIGHHRAGYWLFLLEQPSVQAELHLTEAQRERVAELSQNRQEAFQARPQGPEEWHAIVHKLTTEGEAFFMTLQQDQYQRLKQIAWQHGDVNALGDPELAEALRLNGQQRNEIRRIQEQAHRAWRQAHRRPGEPTAAGKPPAPPRTSFREQIVDVLTDDQKAMWEELRGKKFKGEISSPFRRPHPPGERKSPGRP